MFALARLSMTQIMRILIRMTEDPVGIEEQRKHAPPQWAFRSIAGTRTDHPKRVEEIIGSRNFRSHI
jgi:hypothetical protein